MTYGNLKSRLVQMFPGVSLDLIEGWCEDRYAEILSELPWSRLQVQSRLLTTAPYSTGTVALVNGSQSVTLTGGTWVTGMTGRRLRITGRNEAPYEFTWATGTTGSIDRPYEGVTAPAASYQIAQSVYPLPSDCRMLADDAFSGPWNRAQRFSHAELRRYDWGQTLGSGVATPWEGPISWASYMDDLSTPPRMQVEIFPTPSTATGVPFSYFAEAPSLNGTSTVLQVWMIPSALVEGVAGKIKMHLRDYAGAQLHMVAAEKALKNMRSSESQSLGPSQMSLDPYYTGHRARRYRR